MSGVSGCRCGAVDVGALRLLRRPSATALDGAEGGMDNVAALHVGAAICTTAGDDLDDELLDAAEDGHLALMVVDVLQESLSLKAQLSLVGFRRFNFFAS